MKILHILNEFVDTGNGIVNVCCDLACLQARAGHEVIVVSAGGGHVPLLEACGGRHIRLDQSRRPGNLLAMIVGLARILRAERPEIVHAHMVTGAALASLLRPFGFGYATVSTVHNVYQRSARIMTLSQRVVCLSDRVRSGIGSGARLSRRLAVIENGVIGSPRRSDPAQIAPKPLQRPAVVMVGSVCARKGADVLLEALERTRRQDVHVYWVGNRDWPELEERIARSPAGGRFHLVGCDSEPQRSLRGADLFVLPSRRETFPLSLLEAKWAGLPIIAADVDGTADALRDGDEGLLVPVGDAGALAAAIDRVLDHPQLAATLAAASRASCARFSAQTMTDRYLAEYARLLRPAGGAALTRAEAR